MKGRERIEAALSKDGTSEIPAVICYEGIYVRDHWQQLVPYPWWYRESPDMERQMLWRCAVIEKTGQDWFSLPSFSSREERRHVSIQVLPGGVFRLDGRRGTRTRLEEPQIGGWSASKDIQSIHPDHIARTADEIDALLPVLPAFDASAFQAAGRADFAKEMIAECGKDLYPIRHVGSPLWLCYQLWGFEEMMAFIATRPDLVEYACRRLLSRNIRSIRQAAALGAAGIWIEDCMTDMISPQAFETFNVRFLAQMVGEIRAAGLKSIHYFCGNPAGKWEQLLSVGADALALEESKKGFSIDIEEIVTRVEGRCTVLGNLDAVRVLQNSTEEQLRAEISRQIAAGRKNGGRFVMSIGSPVTPGTSVERVRLYCDLVHELGTI